MTCKPNVTSVQLPHQCDITAMPLFFKYENKLYDVKHFSQEYLSKQWSLSGL